MSVRRVHDVAGHAVFWVEDELSEAVTVTQVDEDEFAMVAVAVDPSREANGLPDEGIAPGTRWDDVPINWVCPECGARKTDFEMVEF